MATIADGVHSSPDLPAVAADMAEAATRLIDSLTGAQKARALYSEDHYERLYWNVTEMALENFDGPVPSLCQYWKFQVWPAGTQTLPPGGFGIPPAPPPVAAFRMSVENAPPASMTPTSLA